MTRATRFLALYSISALTLVSHADVLTVDDDPGADFAFLSIAVNAAAEGDVVLVRDGNYSDAVTIAGKSLTLIAEAGGNVVLGGEITIRDLGPAQHVTVSGIEATGLMSPFDSPPPLLIENCEGAVWIEDCSINSGTSSFNSVNGAIVTNSPRVVMVRTVSSGGNSVFTVEEGGTGLSLFSSSVHLFDCELTGGPGSGQTFDPGTPGGPGVSVRSDSFLYASGSSLQGGVGGLGGSVFGCSDSGDGGPGLELTHASASAALIDTETLGGSPGLIKGKGDCEPGDVGPPRVAGAGTIDDLAPSLSHGFDAASPATSGQPFSIDLAAPVGAYAWIAYSSSPNAFYLPMLLGPTTLGAPSALAPVGVINGTLGTSATITLAPGVLSQDLYLQSVFLRPFPPQIFLSTPAQVTILDPSF